MSELTVFQDALISRRVLERVKQAGILEAPPAMHKSIMEWIEAVLAANNIQAAQDSLDDLRHPANNSYQEALDKLLKAAQVFQAERTWKNYKVLDGAQGAFGATTRWSVKDFQKMTDEKHAELERRAKAAVVDAQELIKHYQQSSQARIKEAENKVRELRQYAKPGVKPMDSDTRQRNFPVELKGWRYNTTKDIQPLLLKRLEKEKGDARRILERFKGKDTSAFEDIIPEFERQVKDGVGYKEIFVTLNLQKSDHYAASWQPGLRRLEVLIPKTATPSDVERLSGYLRHELQHFAQSYLGYIVGHSPLRRQTGMPSRKIRTPQYEQSFNPNHPGHRGDDPNTRALLNSLKQKGVDVRKIDWHSLDDIEFYTKLADSIEGFQQMWRREGRGANLGVAVKLWTGALTVPTDYRARDYKERIERDFGGFETVRNFKLDPFFKALRRRAQGKWRKAVSEFVKAVT